MELKCCIMAPVTPTVPQHILSHTTAIATPQKALQADA
jgi:hypothetical protein